MLYTILRPIVKILLSIYFRKVYFIGKEKIPVGKPLLIASNHPTGFIEPCLMACFFPISLHFMTRGDFFENKIANWFLRSTHQLPIYRKKDGFKSLRKNPNNFSEAIKKLLENEAIIIYIEGSTSQSRQLRPFKKGLGRIASQVLDQDPDSDLLVLPTCVNFSDSNGFRSVASIEIFDPIKLDDYDFSEGQRFDSVNKLTDDIYSSMKTGVFHIDKLEYQEKYNQLLIAYLFNKTPNFFPVEEANDDFKQLGFRLSDQIESLEMESNGAKYWSEDYSFFDVLKLILLAPFALIAWILNVIPASLALSITRKKVKSKEFYGPVLIASSLVIYLVLFITIVLAALIFDLKIILALVLISTTGIVYLYWKEILEKIKISKDFQKKTDSEKNRISDIKKLLHARKHQDH